MDDHESGRAWRGARELAGDSEQVGARAQLVC